MGPRWQVYQLANNSTQVRSYQAITITQEHGFKLHSPSRNSFSHNWRRTMNSKSCGSSIWGSWWVREGLRTSYRLASQCQDHWHLGSRRRDMLQRPWIIPQVCKGSSGTLYFQEEPESLVIPQGSIISLCLGQSHKILCRTHRLFICHTLILKGSLKEPSAPLWIYVD